MSLSSKTPPIAIKKIQQETELLKQRRSTKRDRAEKAFTYWVFVIMGSKLAAGRAVGVSGTTVDNWIRHKVVPSEGMAEKIAALSRGTMTVETVELATLQARIVKEQGATKRGRKPKSQAPSGQAPKTPGTTYEGYDAPLDPSRETAEVKL